MGRLEGKKALITGGTTGIGFASARIFRDEGARIAITGQNAERVRAAGEKLGPDTVAIRCDAGRVAELDGLKQQIEATLGSLDILFLNAGVSIYSDLAAVTEAAFDEMFNVNVKGVLFPVQRLLPLLNKGASIIVTTSMNNSLGMDSTHIYASSKAAARQLVRTLAGELAGRGIRVNALSPGPTITDIGTKMPLTEEQMNAIVGKILPKVPLGRFAAAEELGTAALFLASSDSSFITGQEIVADGGWTGVNY